MRYDGSKESMFLYEDDKNHPGRYGPVYAAFFLLTREQIRSVFGPFRYRPDSINPQVISPQRRVDPALAKDKEIACIRLFQRRLKDLTDEAGRVSGGDAT